MAYGSFNAGMFSLIDPQGVYYKTILSVNKMLT